MKNFELQGWVNLLLSDSWTFKSLTLTTTYINTEDKVSTVSKGIKIVNVGFSKSWNNLKMFP